MTAYYNENDKNAAAWLRELIRKGCITDGVVDDRSIVEVVGSDLAEFERVHFFAGIGGWDYALRLADWAGPVWTGSCPCQPFSVAGKRRGIADERHLWPEFLRLIAECRPATVFGEQVASKDGRGWLSGVRADLEALGYVVGAADLCAAGVGAPHIRQRLFWVAYTTGERARGNPGTGDRPQASVQGTRHTNGYGSDYASEPCGATGGLGDALGPRLEERAGQPGDDGPQREAAERTSGATSDTPSEQVGRTGQSWRDSVWLPCLDGKARRIEPGTFPLAHGVPARVGRLRGYGNAIVPQVAAEFIRAAV